MSNTKLRALLVDDDELFRNHGILPLARRVGLDVAVATNLRDGLESLDRELFGIVFADFHLPDGNGCDLVKKAVSASIDGRPYCIVVSGTRDVYETNAAWRAGAHDFLVKPFLPKEFRSVVARARQALSGPPTSLPFWIGRFAAEHCGADDAIAMLAARYQGKMNREIGPLFGITESGVKQRLSKEFFTPLGAGRLSELDSAARAWFEEEERE